MLWRAQSDISFYALSFSFSFSKVILNVAVCSLLWRIMRWAMLGAPGG